MKHAFLALAAALATAAAPALAQVPGLFCLERQAFVDMLAGKRQQQTVAAGVIDYKGRLLVEVFATADGASFTVLLVAPDGSTACHFGDGTTWRARQVGGPPPEVLE